MIELVLPCPLSSLIVAVIPRVVAVLWGRGVNVRRLEILPVTSAFEPAICFQTKSVRKRSLSLFTGSLAPCRWVFYFSLSNAVLFFFLSEGCICYLYARRHCSVPGVLPLLYTRLSCRVTEECALSHCIRLLVAGGSKSLRQTSPNTGHLLTQVTKRTGG